MTQLSAPHVPLCVSAHDDGQWWWGLSAGADVATLSRFGLIATLAADAAELADAPRGSRVLETIVVTDACRGVLPGLLALG